jgi:FMN phosphatase YigB (HAD superfamily)
MFDPYWDDEDGFLRFEFTDDKVFAHATVSSWNKRVYIKCLAMWSEAKRELKELGYNDIFVIIPNNDKKLIKFEKIFGFVPLSISDKYLLMVCNNTGEEHGS